MVVSSTAERNQKAWKRAAGRSPRRKPALPGQGLDQLSEAVADYGKQALTVEKGKLVRAVDKSPVRIQYADARNPGVKRVKVMVQNVVDHYFAKHKIEWREWKGADNLRAAWHRAGCDGMRVSDLDRTRVDGGAFIPGSADREAYAEYQEKMKALGRHLGRCVWLIVLCNYSAREMAHKVGLGRDDGMGILRIALRALADEYGIPDH